MMICGCYHGMDCSKTTVCAADLAVESAKEELRTQLDKIREACRETSDDWAPEHPPYAAQELIERIESILDGKDESR